MLAASTQAAFSVVTGRRQVILDCTGAGTTGSLGLQKDLWAIVVYPLRLPGLVFSAVAMMVSLASATPPTCKGRRCAFHSNATNRQKVNCRAQVQGLAQEDAVGATDVQALNALLSRVEAQPVEPEPGMALSTASDGAIDLMLGDDYLMQPDESSDVQLLPELEQPAVCHEHRVSPASAGNLDAVLATSKFRERFYEFMQQLKTWGYASGAIELPPSTALVALDKPHVTGPKST